MKTLHLFILAIIVSLGAFLRLHNIAAYTEFRGDQGRAGLVALKAIQTGEIPLAGPTTLKNQHLGPFFYYLSILFFGIGNFNPVIPAIGTALTGIVAIFLLFMLLKTFISVPTALAITLLWTVSPDLIHQDRIFWEPNFVPFFSLLFFYAAIMIRKTNRIRFWFMIGGSLSILIQLHYFNIFFFIVFLALIFRAKRSHIAASVSVFLLLLSPFIIFELQNNWKDIREITTIIIADTTSHQHGKRLVIHNALDYGGRIIGYFVPIGENTKTKERMTIFIFLSILSFFYFIKKSSFLHLISIGSMLWILTGSVAMGMYSDTVYNHYLGFLIVPTAMLIGAILERMKEKISALAIITGIIVISIIQTQRLLKLYTPTHDILRVKYMTEAVIRLANHHPFSFTLFPSVSFSDLHYRYYFMRMGYNPVPITNQSFEYLFVICDTYLPCSNILPENIPILCYENHCGRNYGTLNIKNDWTNVGIEKLPYGTIFTLKRN